MESQAVAGSSSHQKAKLPWGEESEEPMSKNEVSAFIASSMETVNKTVTPFLQEQGLNLLIHGTSAAVQSGAAASTGPAAPFVQVSTGLITPTIAATSAKAVKPVTDPLIAASVQKATDSSQRALEGSIQSFSQRKDSSQNSWSSI